MLVTVHHQIDAAHMIMSPGAQLAGNESRWHQLIRLSALSATQPE